MEQDKINIGLAIVLFVLYVLYLVYMIRTHPEEFASVAKHEESEHGQHWSLALCIGVLVASSVLAALLSEVLVGAVEGTGEALGLSTAFLGIVLLASVGGVAEGMSAVTMAHKGSLRPVDSALRWAAVSSSRCSFRRHWCSQATSWDRIRSSCPSASGGVGLLFLSVLIGTFVASGGSGNWYKGVQLLAVYLMIALLLYFVPL